MFSDSALSWLEQHVQDSYLQTTEHNIRQFESELGVALPRDYREFLCRFNGGYLVHNEKLALPHASAERAGFTFTGVECFFGLNTGEPYSDLRGPHDHFARYRRDLDDSIPKDFLPIGSMGADRLVMRVTGDSVGGLYLWLASDAENPVSYNNCYVVSESFTKFVDMLMHEQMETPRKERTEFELTIQGDLVGLRHRLDRGIDVNKTDPDGRTLLILAAIHRWPHLIPELLSRGAVATSMDNTGRTALHWACKSHSIDAVSNLVEASAEINAVDNEGRTSLMMAVSLHNTRMANLLLDRGAKVGIISKHGETAESLCTQVVLRRRLADFRDKESLQERIERSR